MYALKTATALQWLLVITVIQDTVSDPCLRIDCTCQDRARLNCAGDSTINIRAIQNAVSVAHILVLDLRRRLFSSTFLGELAEYMPHLQKVRVEGCNCAHIIPYIGKLPFTIVHDCMEEYTLVESTLQRSTGGTSVHVTPTISQDNTTAESTLQRSTGGTSVSVTPTVSQDNDTTAVVTTSAAGWDPSPAARRNAGEVWKQGGFLAIIGLAAILVSGVVVFLIALLIKLICRRAEDRSDDIELRGLDRLAQGHGGRAATPPTACNPALPTGSADSSPVPGTSASSDPAPSSDSENGDNSASGNESFQLSIHYSEKAVQTEDDESESESSYPDSDATVISDISAQPESDTEVGTDDSLTDMDTSLDDDQYSDTTVQSEDEVQRLEMVAAVQIDSARERPQEAAQAARVGACAIARARYTPRLIPPA